MKLSAGAWVRLPLALLRERGLTKAAAAVCCVLLDRATSAAELSAWVVVSVSDLVADTGYSRRKIFYALDDLETLGLIERERNGIKGTPSRYRLRSECIELCGRAAEPKKAYSYKQSKSKKSADEAELEAAYLSLVNNFKEEDDNDC